MVTRKKKNKDTGSSSEQKETKPRVPTNVKSAMLTLTEHLKCDVVANKLDDGTWILLAKTVLPKLPVKWKGLEVRRV